jgi:hypothetical protein
MMQVVELDMEVEYKGKDNDFPLGPGNKKIHFLQR